MQESKCTLDDAHEALSVAAWLLEQDGLQPASAWAEDVILCAIEDIEAQLPDPCPNCGSDSDWSEAHSRDFCWSCFRQETEENMVVVVTSLAPVAPAPASKGDGS